MQSVSMLITEADTANSAVICTLSIWLQFMDMLMLAARVAAQFQYDRSIPQLRNAQAAQARLQTLVAAVF